MLSYCDLCDKRYGTRVLVVYGCETVVCDKCADDEEDCTCEAGMKAARSCPVHAIDPDEAYDRKRDEGIGC